MKKIIKQILKFGLVGGLAFLIDFGFFVLLTYFGMHYLIAQIISFSIALAFNYILSTRWVFEAKSQSKKEVLVFIILSIVGLIINEILLYIGIDILSYHELLIKLISTFIVMVYNFITRKLIIER